MLSPDQHAPENEGIPFPWLTTARAQRATRPVPWQDALSPVWIPLIEGWNAETMGRFDYARAPLDPEPTRGEKIAALTRELPETIRYFHRVSQSLGVLARNRFTPAETQVLANSANPAAWEANPHWRLPDPPAVPGM